MKDLYSFCRTKEEHELFYEKAKQAYLNVFRRVGLGKETYVTFASGGTFAKYSHEFQTVTDAGEDVIYVNEEKHIAINKEVLNDEVLADLGVTRDSLVEKKAVEVGNIFSLGTRFSEAFGLNYKDEAGKSVPVVMGSYGIGPGRVMGTVVEALSDAKGIVWPVSIAPFAVHVLCLQPESEVVAREAERLYVELQKRGIEVLLDDRGTRAGEKFADAELIGIPVSVVVSEKSCQDGSVEVKVRATGITSNVTLSLATSAITDMVEALKKDN